MLAADLVFDLVMDNRRGNEQFDQTRAHQAWQEDGARAAVISADQLAIRRVLGAAITADPLTWFTAKLEVVLVGITRTLAPAEDSSRP